MENKLIFRASDASAALEKVQNALGPDAYIIEINNVGNFVEITASKDRPDPQKPKKPSEIAKTLPEVPVKSVGSTAYITTPQLEPILGEVGYPEDENSRQQNIFNENVFHDFAQAQKRSEKPLKKVTQVAIAADPLQVAPVASSASITKPKPSSIAKSRTNKSLAVNSTRPILQQGHDTFVFGDLLNFGLSPAFIKKEFDLEEFDGAIARSTFTEKLVKALFDSDSTSLFEDFENLVFLGTPGAGKSTICAKLMHYFGTKYAAKPSIIHVTPEKLFEADRLRFHAKMFNFPFYRKYVPDNAAICQAKRQIVEIAWENQMSFANYFSKNHKSYPSLKPFIVLPAEINHRTLKEVLRVSPMVYNLILNKCDFGRFSLRNLMMIYEKGYKIAFLSGDRSVSAPLEMADTSMLHGFVEYTLDL